MDHHAPSTNYLLWNSKLKKWWCPALLIANPKLTKEELFSDDDNLAFQTERKEEAYQFKGMLNKYYAQNFTIIAINDHTSPPFRRTARIRAFKRIEKESRNDIRGI